MSGKMLRLFCDYFFRSATLNSWSQLSDARATCFLRLFDPAYSFNFLAERAKQTINFAVSFGECYEVKIKRGFGCWISTRRKLAGENATSTYSNRTPLVTAHAKGSISFTLVRAVILNLDIMLVTTSKYPLHEHSGLKNARIPLWARKHPK